MKRHSVRCTLVLCLFGLAACTVGPDYHRPTAALPSRWTASVSASSSGGGEVGGGGAPSAGRLSDDRLDLQWWASFHDPELSSLIERVATSNLDVRTASARLTQARAARRIAGADAMPTVTGSAAYLHGRSSRQGLVDVAGLDGKADYNVWQPGLGASWELDLSGRVRRAVESADASIEAVADLRRDLLVSAIAETATDYLSLRGVQAQRDIVLQNLDTARHSLALTRIRLGDGVATRLDVAEAAAEVSTIEAQLPRLEHRRTRLANALSFLMGTPPHALDDELQIGAVNTATARSLPGGSPPALQSELQPALQPALPRVPMGLPSELAERRPDIREAEARLHAATAEIGVAVGDFYPRITLSANLSLQAMHFGDLDRWDARMFGVGPALSVPIFEGGRLKGQLALRQAQQQEAAIQFQRTVLKAWHEVDNAMSDYGTLQSYREHLTEAVEQNRVALDNARRQYIAGATDFVNVLTVQKDLLAAQQALTASSTEVSVALVTLFTSLGGGWETTYPVASSTVAGAVAAP